MKFARSYILKAILYFPAPLSHVAKRNSHETPASDPELSFEGTVRLGSGSVAAAAGRLYAPAALIGRFGAAPQLGR
jgi:hypothetical protein